MREFSAAVNDTDSIPTRQSLLARIKDWGDQESWREFFETYWRLIHATALKSGLAETEAQEVVQEVMIAVAKKMPGFSYDPAKDSLKGWLLSVTRWKINDQFRKRWRGLGPTVAATPPSLVGRGLLSSGDEETGTATVERVADPQEFDLEAIWDSEWREHLLQTALDRTKRQVNPAHYEMYHLHVIQGLPAKETARALNVSIPAVHLAKFRVGRRLRAEIACLESGKRDR